MAAANLPNAYRIQNAPKILNTQSEKLQEIARNLYAYVTKLSNSTLSRLLRNLFKTHIIYLIGLTFYLFDRLGGQLSLHIK